MVGIGFQLGLDSLQQAHLCQQVTVELMLNWPCWLCAEPQIALSHTCGKNSLPADSPPLYDFQRLQLQVWRMQAHTGTDLQGIFPCACELRASQLSEDDGSKLEGFSLMRPPESCHKNET